jgi:DNA-binding response OmpR family regulator
MVRRQILIVDGDVIHSERLKSNLEAENYIVDVVYNGIDAIMTLKRKWVDLIISSITLQGTMNGIQLLQEIKKYKDFSNIPVIIQTSKVNLEQNVYDIGATLFVAKPYNINDFIKKIKELLPD